MLVSISWTPRLLPKSDYILLGALLEWAMDPPIGQGLGGGGDVFVFYDSRGQVGRRWGLQPRVREGLTWIRGFCRL